MFPVQRSLLLAASVVLASCTTGPKLLPEAASAAPACCATFAAFPFKPYLPYDLATLNLSKSSPMGPLPTGESPAEGISLPSKPQTTLLEFRVMRQGVFASSATVLVPTFTFLDDEYRVLGAAEPRIFQGIRRLAEPSALDTPFYGAAFVPPHTRYVVVATEAHGLATKKVKLIASNGLDADRQLEQDLRYYTTRSPADFARGDVNPPSDAAPWRLVDRAPFGEVMLRVTDLPASMMPGAR